MQDIVQLPESALVKHNNAYLNIKNHAVCESSLGLDYGSLFLWTLSLIRKRAWDGLPGTFDQNKISFEAFIETCVDELENSYKLTSHTLWWNYGFRLAYFDADESVKDESCYKVASYIADRIRTCENWEEFYTAMKPKGTFSKSVKKLIRGELTS